MRFAQVILLLERQGNGGILDAFELKKKTEMRCKQLFVFHFILLKARFTVCLFTLLCFVSSVAEC